MMVAQRLLLLMSSSAASLSLARSPCIGCWARASLNCCRRWPESGSGAAVAMGIQTAGVAAVSGLHSGCLELAAMDVVAPQPAAAGWSLLAVGLLALFPASEAVVAVIHRLISESVRPQHLPRLALLDGIPAAHRVLVVIPGMLDSTASAAELAHRLHLHYWPTPTRRRSLRC